MLLAEGRVKVVSNDPPFQLVPDPEVAELGVEFGLIRRKILECLSLLNGSFEEAPDPQATNSSDGMLAYTVASASLGTLPFLPVLR
jgi:hypothetical protein